MTTLYADDGTTVQLATRIPKSLHRAIRLDAIERGQSLMEWVSAALGTHLERVKARKPEKHPTPAAK